MCIIESDLYVLCAGRPRERFQPLEVKGSPGVYQIVATDETGRPLPLDRVAGRDTEGILYIGESTDLLRRLRLFRNQVCPAWGATTGHAGGDSYLESQPLQNICPPERLHFHFEHCLSFVERETQLIRAYLNHFGEVPPLNLTR